MLIAHYHCCDGLRLSKTTQLPPVMPHLRFSIVAERFQIFGKPCRTFSGVISTPRFPLRGIKSFMRVHCVLRFETKFDVSCGGAVSVVGYVRVRTRVFCVCVSVCAMEHRVMCDRMPCALCLCLANRTTHSLLHRFAASLKEVDPLPLLPGSSTTRTLPAR